MGLKLDAFRAGAPADLIVTHARDFTELFARPQAGRTVLRAGVPAAPPPEYAEIDALEGLY
jgi:cytosine deaminase